MRVEEEQELMKHRLSFLPEFKQEIQSLLMLPQNKKLPPHIHFHEQYIPLLELTENRKIFSRLQDNLSRLEKLPNIQEILDETDRIKVANIFGEFEKIKLSARLSILTIRTNLELGLENWGVGNRINHLWAVNILPFFYIPARVVVIFEDSCYRIAFGVCLSEERVSTSVLTMDLPPSWIDPLEKPLRRLDLFQKTKQLSLDGIEYELFTRSWTSQNTIWFGNPSTDPFIEIEKAFFGIAEMVANEKGQIDEKNYLAQWQRYLAQPKNA